ncbi:hypothetical protein CHUAL_007112 [Chamberlinius hualienensis]
MSAFRLSKFYSNFSIIRAIGPLILLLLAFGFDIDPPNVYSRKRQIILNVIFGFHLFVSGGFLFIGTYIARFDREDVTSLIYSLSGFVFITDLIMSKLLVRHYVNHLQKLVKLMKIMSEFTGQNNGKFMFKFWIFSLIFTIFPASCLLTIFGKADDKLPYYQKHHPHLLNLHQFLIAPLTVMWCLTIISMLLILIVPLIYYLNFLSNIKFSAANNLLSTKGILKEIVYFVRLHRHACQYLNVYDKIFRHILLQLFLMEMISCLVFGRSAVVGGMLEQNIYAAVKYFILLAAEIIVIGIVNQMIISCLNEFVYVKSRLDARSKAMEMTAAISTKVDLYVTHVQLTKPAITLGGLVSIEISSVFSMAGFYVTYLCFLYDQ